MFSLSIFATSIASKMVSESLLSLYPIFVKNIALPISLQLWSRFFSYFFISAFFIQYDFIQKYLFSWNGWLLSMVTILHVYTSYRGFQLLESGIAYTIFYLHPWMILWMAGKQLHPLYFIAFLGVAVLMWEEKDDTHTHIHKKQYINTGIEPLHNNSPYNRIWGVGMCIAAAITEAWIYFLVRRIPTENSWNHIFLSYFIGGMGMTVLWIKDITQLQIQSLLSLSLVINIIIGLLGYLLRFYAISHLPTTIYAPLSYLGIVMAYTYGIIFQGDFITLSKIVGTAMIIGSSWFAVYEELGK